MCGFLETLHNAAHRVIGIFRQEKLSSKESLDLIRAQLLVGEQKAIQNLQDSGFVVRPVTTARAENAHCPQPTENIHCSQQVENGHYPQPVMNNYFPQLILGTYSSQSVMSTYSPQPIRKRSTEERSSKKTRVTIAETNREAFLREQRQMLKTRERIAKHRARRAARASSGIPIWRSPTKPSFTQLLTSHSPPALSKLAHDISFYENQTHEESRRYVQERLTDILGPERMKSDPLLPSGHNPVDPVIDEYNQQAVTNNILQQWEDHKIELRRQEEEKKHQIEEEKAEQLRIQVLLDHYRKRYVDRLERLALYGSAISTGIDRIETALLAEESEEAASIMLDITCNVFLPIHDLLTECKQEIPLEEIGAEKLKCIWPLERLEGMYIYLQDYVDIFPEALQMLQGIEAVCKAVSNPTPFQDPLAPKQVSAGNFYSKLRTEAVKPTTTTETATETATAAQASPPEGLSVLGADPAPTGSGFSKLLQATAEAANAEQQKVSVPASSGFSKLLVATAAKLRGDQEAVSDAAPDALSGNISPPESEARSAVLHYIATDNMYFESEVQDLVKRDSVTGIHRRNAAGCLKELLQLANGEKGILGEMDAGNYRCQIEKCVYKIDALKGSARFNKETQALKKLCASALMLWSVYC